MATANIAVTATYTLVAGAALAAFVLSADEAVELVVTAADATAPAATTRGHRIEGGQGATRDLLGAGAVWARSSTPTAVVRT